MRELKVLIAGGGIGGLTAALCLAKVGHRVSLLEQTPDFVAAGAGIQLSPNCSRVLHDLGLAPQLSAHAFLPVGSQFRHWRTGKVIAESELGDAVLARYGAPYYHIHRGDLLKVLVDAVRMSDRIEVHQGVRLSGVQQRDSAIELEFANSQAGNASFTHVDVVVGADGIHSATRASLWGEERPRFTGNVAWRALVPSERLPKDLIRPVSSVWWGPGKHFVHYYVRGGALVNCVCVVEKSGWNIESWNEPGDLAELKADFAGWHDTITQLINCVDQDSLYKWALYDREPMAQWGQGCVTLLGDACHPTLPFMAQGAAMAIEDAAVLARCLAASDDVATNLARYEHLRRERTARIQMGSRRNAKVFHMSGLQALLRNRAAKAARNHTMHRLFSYNALEVVSN